MFVGGAQVGIAAGGDFNAGLGGIYSSTGDPPKTHRPLPCVPAAVAFVSTALCLCFHCLCEPETLPLPCVSTDSAKTPPLPCVSIAFVAKTLPLPCVFTAFVANEVLLRSQIKARHGPSTLTPVLPSRNPKINVPA